MKHHLLLTLAMSALLWATADQWLPTAPAEAHAPYTGLRSPLDGVLCCGVQDCAPAPHRYGPDGGDELLFEDIWWPVDPRVVLDGALDDDHWHACRAPADTELRCVIRPGAGV